MGELEELQKQERDEKQGKEKNEKNNEENRKGRGGITKKQKGIKRKRAKGGTDLAMLSLRRRVSSL
jgi:hypothetical protein